MPFWICLDTKYCKLGGPEQSITLKNFTPKQGE